MQVKNDQCSIMHDFAAMWSQLKLKLCDQTSVYFKNGLSSLTFLLRVQFFSSHSSGAVVVNILCTEHGMKMFKFKWALRHFLKIVRTHCRSLARQMIPEAVYTTSDRYHSHPQVPPRAGAA